MVKLRVILHPKWLRQNQLQTLNLQKTMTIYAFLVVLSPVAQQPKPHQIVHLKMLKLVLMPLYVLEDLVRLMGNAYGTNDLIGLSM